MKIWGTTDIGLVRKENQDAYLIRENLPSGHSICVVCDGMGGSAGGQLASKIATETFAAELEKVLQPDMEPEQLRAASSYAVALANDAIRSAATEIEDYRNMGTTLVAAVSYAGGAVITNVGDSRAYHICESGITRITKDHSLVESMVDRGDITAEQARRHPNRNLITRALGPDADAQCDGYICPLEAGEYLLLCTDGLSNYATEEKILQIINGNVLDKVSNLLIDEANNGGGRDNITAAVISSL